MFCLFIKSYWNVNQAILKYSWRVLNCDFEEISDKYNPPKIFGKCRRNRVENGNNNSPAKARFNSSEISRGSFLDLEVSILSKYFNSIS
jgi:hypothetical protein